MEGDSCQETHEQGAHFSAMTVISVPRGLVMSVQPVFIVHRAQLPIHLLEVKKKKIHPYVMGLCCLTFKATRF